LQRSQNEISDVLIAFAVEAGSPNLIAIRFSRSRLSIFPFGIMRSSPIAFSQRVH
jgi:Holliday junction resolvase